MFYVYAHYTLNTLNLEFYQEQDPAQLGGAYPGEHQPRNPAGNPPAKDRAGQRVPLPIHTSEETVASFHQLHIFRRTGRPRPGGQIKCSPDSHEIPEGMPTGRKILI